MKTIEQQRRDYQTRFMAVEREAEKAEETGGLDAYDAVFKAHGGRYSGSACQCEEAERHSNSCGWVLA